MTSPRWPRLLDILAVALVFNLCAAAPEVEAGQGDIEPTLAKERVKGAQMLEHFSSDEWADRMAHEDWMETVKAAGEHVKEAFKDAEHVAYITGAGPLIVQRPYHYADSKSAATYN